MTLLRFCKKWFKEWALRLRPAKDMHALHLEFEQDEESRRMDRADTNLMSPSMMDMLQWVLHGVEEAVQVISITETHPPMFHFNTQSSQRMVPERFFSQLTHLRSLRLIGALAKNHTEACPHLRQCLISLRQLHDLVLSNNGLNAEDLKSLEPAWKHLPALQSLNLGGNQFNGDAACSMAIALRSLTTLTFLSLFNNFLFCDIEDELTDFQMLSSAINGLSQLWTLDMSSSASYDPSRCAALAAALNNLTTLQHLNLDHSDLYLDASDVFYPAVLSGLTGLQHLSMAGFYSLENVEGFASVLRTLTGLQYLYLSNGSGLCGLIESPHFVSSLQGLTRLEHLDLSMAALPPLRFQLETDFYYPALERMQLK
ncbi:hypothetical protein CEUSTIGMA_g6770.t1 [Chlamydomonas eustigma]|uniref:Uncharacterized protein n=1 Tax=Chlamydomonas eustigma TaxID=1157962 RepID=A0A250X8T4_9CHLO|nr:hypothetical protein CEUSTIGMA_g6770.t1 [Chlamydomonas eustigma]|eukprot:GAX79329.1 hypothetical protein CEUSTIGMA_g6770.t1 [Chlamydomonas eustigma]